MEMRFNPDAWRSVSRRGEIREQDISNCIGLFDHELTYVNNLASENPWAAFGTLMEDISYVNKVSFGVWEKWPERIGDIGSRLNGWVQNIYGTMTTIASKIGPPVDGFSIGVGVPIGLTIALNFSMPSKRAII